MMSSEYGRRITVNPMLLTWLSRPFQFADQMPCGIRLLVSKPNQLTPVNRTTLPAESTIFDPEVDQNPSPGAAAASREAASKMATASKNVPAAHVKRCFMIRSRDWVGLTQRLRGSPLVPRDPSLDGKTRSLVMARPVSYTHLTLPTSDLV